MSDPRSATCRRWLAVALGGALALAGAAAAAPRERPTALSLLPARAKGPVTLVVSTDAQRLTVYDGEEAVGGTTVSTGVADHPTPHGVFSIIDKRRYHESNIYSAAPMPYMQRLTWSGIALHEGRVTGAPASHGCIRLPGDFARALFSFTREGARVVIAREDAWPTRLHGAIPFLKAPAPTGALPEAPVSLPGEIEPTAASVLSRPPAPQDIATRAPVAILVNRKAGKIYVRRAFTPLFEAPIAIADRERPLGLHLLTAQAGAGGALAWSALGATGAPRVATPGFSTVGRLGVADIMVDDARPRKRARARADESMVSLAPPPPPEPSAQEALGRLSLAPGVAARIAALIGTGATIILSDEGARGRETWNGTNFIALSE